VQYFAHRRYRSNVRQYQALFYLSIKQKPELVSRALQPVLQESIGAIGGQNGAARQASPASGRKVRRGLSLGLLRLAIRLSVTESWEDYREDCSVATDWRCAPSQATFGPSCAMSLT
jgi:hypothetical protein